MGDEQLERRLRRLGEVSVPPTTEAAHLRAMAEVSPPRWRFGWRAVAAAGLVGFLAGSTGLAAAGALPAPAQDVAHDVLGAVGVNVPRSTEGCPDGASYRNHGEYVSAVEAAGGDVEAAAHSDCGMPLRGGGTGNGNGAGAGTPRPDADGDPCTGPPPWAGAHLSRAERDAARAEHEALCGTDDVEADDPEPEAVEPPPASDAEETTSTVAPETTTTTEAPPEITTTTVG